MVKLVSQAIECLYVACNGGHVVFYLVFFSISARTRTVQGTHGLHWVRMVLGTNSPGTNGLSYERSKVRTVQGTNGLRYE